MQIGLEQIIQVIMQRLESLEMSLEDMKFRTNVALRILRTKGDLDLEEVKLAVTKEYEALISLSEEHNQENEISEDQINEIANGIIKWVDNDLEEMKNKMKEYNEKIKEMMEKENNKSNISVAPADLLNHLDGIKQQNNNNKKKKSGNIIMP